MIFFCFFPPLDQIPQSWDGEKDQNHQRFTARGESPTWNHQRNRFRGFLIQWYSCVCSCNFTRLEGELVSISGGHTGRNWSTSPEYVAVPFDRRCDCDCHGSCGWQIGSLSASSALPPPLACTTLRQPCNMVYGDLPSRLGHKSLTFIGGKYCGKHRSTSTRCRISPTWFQLKTEKSIFIPALWQTRRHEFGAACGLPNYMTRSRRMLLYGGKPLTAAGRRQIFTRCSH